MIYFPQLSSGATGQFPITRQRVSRTVVNRSCQNYQIKLADPGAAITEWHLTFEELSDQELAAIEALFEAVEGSLTPFTFLDPADNLLAWSEQQTQPVWQASSLLTLTGGVSDPLGGTNAYQVTNLSTGVLTLEQTINAPASLDYCLSVYACSAQSNQIWLVRGTETTAYTVTGSWARLISAGQLESTAQTVNFGIAVGPGETVQVFGMQVEAQTAASLYKQTSESGGVYLNARFRDDTLTVTAVGPGRYSCDLDIVNVEYI